MRVSVFHELKLNVLFRFHVHFVLYMAENLEQHRSLLSNFEAFVAVGILG